MLSWVLLPVNPFFWCLCHDGKLFCFFIFYFSFYFYFENTSLYHFPSEHAEKYGYGVVERFVGHGVGTVFHSEPIIYHHRK